MANQNSWTVPKPVTFPTHVSGNSTSLLGDTRGAFLSMKLRILMPVKIILFSIGVYIAD